MQFLSRSIRSTKRIIRAASGTAVMREGETRCPYKRTLCPACAAKGWLSPGTANALLGRGGFMKLFFVFPFLLFATASFADPTAPFYSAGGREMPVYFHHQIETEFTT